VGKSTSWFPKLSVVGDGSGVLSHAGAVLLVRVAERTGLIHALSTGLARWRKPLASHDPGKVVLDLAVALALGGDCLADVAQLRAHPEVFGPVASDPTVSRLIATLAADAPTALSAINAARAAARASAWSLAGCRAPDQGVDETQPLVVDIDATLVTAHSDKELAALLPSKRGHRQWEAGGVGEQAEGDLRFQAAFFGEPGFAEPIAGIGFDVKGGHVEQDQRGRPQPGMGRARRRQCLADHRFGDHR
jgi:hypothetical protein